MLNAVTLIEPYLRYSHDTTVENHRSVTKPHNIRITRVIIVS